MSSVTQHRLDRRATILANKIRHRRGVLTDMLRPPGSPIPLTEQLTNEEALAFWRKHRYSPTGQDIIKGWQPHETMQLDAWLARNPDPSLRGGGQYGALGEPLGLQAANGR